MNNNLYKLRDDLWNVILELEAIAGEIEIEFSGIGEKECAESLRRTAYIYRKNIKQIEKQIAIITKFTSGGGGTGSFGGGSGDGGFR